MLSGIAELAGARRGRPPNVARRREIARAAVAAFADHGYDGCSMANVAARCGLSRTLVVRYFARKELLLAAVVDFVRERTIAAADAARAVAARNPPLREFLLHAGNIQLHHVDELAAWYALRLGGLPLDAEQHAALRAAEESVYATVAAFARAHGASADAYVLARTFLGALQSLVLMQNRAAFEPATADLRGVFLEELVELVLHGAQERPR